MMIANQGVIRADTRYGFFIRHFIFAVMAGGSHHARSEPCCRRSARGRTGHRRPLFGALHLDASFISRLSRLLFQTRLRTSQPR